MSISVFSRRMDYFLHPFGSLWVCLDHLCWELSTSSVYWFLVLFLFYVLVLPLLLILVWGYYFLVFSKVWLTCSGWSFPYSTYNRVGFLDRYCLNLDLSWNIFLHLFWLTALLDIAGWVTFFVTLVFLELMSRLFWS